MTIAPGSLMINQKQFPALKTCMRVRVCVNLFSFMYSFQASFHIAVRESGQLSLHINAVTHKKSTSEN